MNYWMCLQSLALSILMCVEGREKANNTPLLLLKHQPESIRGSSTAENKSNSTILNETLTRPRKLRWLQARNISKSSKYKDEFNATTNMKAKHIHQGKRKSDIDIHASQAKAPVVYTSPDGKDYYVYVRTNENPQQSQVNQQGTVVVPNLPSKTFLVTVYGEQLEGAEDKLRNAITNPPPKKCCCKCSKTSCEHTEEACPCDEARADKDKAVSLQMGGQKLVLFPNAGRPFGRNGCMCPCCLCSCSESWGENYNCGCQKLPPVPCPCSSTSGAGNQPQISIPAGSDCQCSDTSQTPCDCNGNSLPIPEVTSPVSTNGNQVASWTGGTSSCPCPCCQCACTQPEMYPNYQCGCANQSPNPCPCDNHAWNFDQSGAENNAARSPENDPYPSTAESVGRSAENSPYPTSTPTNNGAVSQTFRSGDYQIENSCNCYCCPCSCPGAQYSAYENSQCNCGQPAACTCRRSEVREAKQIDRI